jgi:ABC-2 type transport system ATP-binding protein
VQGPEDAVFAHLQGIEGVVKVEEEDTHSDATSRYTLATVKDRDLRADVARAIIQQGWQLLELRSHRLSVEEVLIELVTEEETADA